MRPARWSVPRLAAASCALAAVAAGQVSTGDALGAVRLGADGGLPGVPFASNCFDGWAVAPAGDIDGDGAQDIVMRHCGDPLVVFLNLDGSVKTTSGPFHPGLASLAYSGFGECVVVLDDGDGDGRRVLAVGAPFGDEDGLAGGPDYGAIYFAELPPDGVIVTSDWTWISASTPVVSALLASGDQLGSELCAIDLDGDGLRTDLAVGLSGGEGVGPDEQTGSVMLLDLDDADPSVVLAAVEIAEGQAGFGGPLDTYDQFWRGLAPLGDMDGDGVEDLAVGAPGDHFDGTSASTGGVVWILRLSRNLQGDVYVAGESRIGIDFGFPPGSFPTSAAFGAALANAGDLDGNGQDDLLVGAPDNYASNQQPGSVWLLRLGPTGSMLGAESFGVSDPDLAALTAVDDYFGFSVAALGDADGDGVHMALAGAMAADGGPYEDSGALIEFFFAGLPGGQTYSATEASIDGRPGRSALVLPPAGLGPGDELELEPVVVVPSTQVDKVLVESIFAADGGGVFFALTNALDTGDAPAQASASDLAGSSHYDILTANKGDGTISFLLGTGPGSYAPHVDTPLPFDAAPVALGAADMDGDGDSDVVTAGDGGVTVFKGDGVGTFSAFDFTALLKLTDLALGDVDGDGDVDVVAASGAVAAGPGFEQGVATVLVNAGPADLSVSSTFAFGKAVASVLLLDADGDGDLDALTAVHELDGGSGGVPQGVLDLHVNQGGAQGGSAGAYLPGTSFAGHFTPEALGFHPTYGAVGDVDGDGDLDAVYTSSDNIAFAPETFAHVQPPLALTVLLSDGAGDFVVATLGTPFVGKGVAPILTDFLPPPSGDGHLDAILVFSADDLAGLVNGPASSQTTFFAALIGDGTGGFASVAANQFLAGEEPGEGDSGDFGGPAADGPASAARDLVLPLAATNQLLVLQGDGAGGVASTQLVHDVDASVLDPQGAWQGGPRVVRVARLNADELDDVVVLSRWEDASGLVPSVPGSLATFTGSGTGGLVPHAYVALARGGELAVGDVTGDGLADVVVSQRLGSGGPDGLLVLAGDGNGGLATSPPLLAVPVAHELVGGIAVADADGDGDRDVFTAANSAGAGVLLLYRNTAGALLPESHALGSAWGAVQGIEVAQLAGDATPDVAIGLADGSLVVARADGLGGYAKHELPQAVAAGGGGALRLADINGDAATDIVSASGGEQPFVRTTLGDGAGGFVLQTVDGLSSVGAFGPLRPIVDDFDGDLTLDIALSHGSGDVLSILPNHLSTWEAYGSGKPGSSGVPVVLQGLGYTSPGGAAAVSLSGALGGAPAAWFLGVGRIEGPGFLHVGAVLFQIPLQLGGAAGEPGAGGLFLPLVIPNDTRLLGIEFTMQFLVLDPGAGPPGPGKISASNGLALTVLP